jgi:hypothetical protein
MLGGTFAPVTVMDESWLGWERHDDCREMEFRKADSDVYLLNESEEVVDANRLEEPSLKRPSSDAADGRDCKWKTMDNAQAGLISSRWNLGLKY